MAENDQKDKTVEKVTGEVENTDKKENNEDRYEKVCFICHRPESVTGKMGCAKSNDVAAMVRKYSAMGRIAFMHIRNVKIMADGSFEERAHHVIA